MAAGTIRRPGVSTGPYPRVLFIDAYDSYSNNIITLLRTVTKADIETIKIDDGRFVGKEAHIFESFLRDFYAVVIGPGPGDPHLVQDVGLIDRIWSLDERQILPVLGVCLGFQSLVLACGGTVERLREPRHGIVTAVTHRGQSLFQGLREVRATQYHSLHASLGHDLTDPDVDLWERTTSAPHLQPLAWDLSDRSNGPILMAVSHTARPFCAIQYHPESVRTNSEGAGVIANWWAGVRRFRRSGSPTRSLITTTGRAQETDSGYGTDDETPDAPRMTGPFSADPRKGHTLLPPRRRMCWTHIDLPGAIDLVPKIYEHLESSAVCPAILLESGCKQGEPVRAETGRYSIIGVADQDTHHFQYWTHGHFEHTRGEVTLDARTSDVCEVLEVLKAETAARLVIDGPAEVPFWGGLIGYISYEAGLESINVPVGDPEPHEADVHFVAVERSIVIDHCRDRAYVQSLLSNDDDWIATTGQWIRDIAKLSRPHEEADPVIGHQVQYPDEAVYCAKVQACQAHIRAGDSYELCLTDTSSILFDADLVNDTSAWSLYKKLRTNNPAPFGAFMSFDGIAIASSSPERFLSWSRDGICEFRPIKGTVQKSAVASREDAEAILNGDKEQAENLMIVDLIRHDLNGVLAVIGAQAEVPKLMQIEEYETVYQLVSVIRGDLSASCSAPTYESSFGIRDRGGTVPDDGCEHVDGSDRQPGSPPHVRAHGIDVLRASLPPGSMTGAPKKRSCELLQGLEKRRRGLYSGVLGYLDVGGGGDFSVVIRSIVRTAAGCTISAGGAVTARSDPIAEWEEMMGKSRAVQI